MIQLIRTAALITLFLTSAQASPRQSEEPHLLRWRFEVGERIRLRSVQDKQITTTPKGGKKVKQRKTRTVDLALRILGAEESLGVYSCELTLQRIQERVRSKKQDVTLDSSVADPAKRPGGANLAGQPIRFRMTDRGEVLALESIAGQPLREAPAEVREQVEAAVGDGFVRALLLNQLGTFPEEAISPKASWTSSSTMPIPGLGAAELTVTNTLARTETKKGQPVCVIRQKGEADLGGDGSLGAVEIESWTQKSTVRFSLQQGRILSASGTSTLRTRFELLGRSGKAIVKSRNALTRVD